MCSNINATERQTKAKTEKHSILSVSMLGRLIFGNQTVGGMHTAHRFKRAFIFARASFPLKKKTIFYTYKNSIICQLCVCVNVCKHFLLIGSIEIDGNKVLFVTIFAQMQLR